MPFELPRYEDLTDQQRLILNLPYNQNILVQGAPGTGKTVLAIYRASDLEIAGMNVLVLVYNKPLKLYISAAVRSLDLQSEVKTWQAWIDDFYHRVFHRAHPRSDNRDQFSYNWEQIVRDFQGLNTHYYQHIILDEAQDIPLELIVALRLISSSISCFMDPNQTIGDMFVEPAQVGHVLGVDGAFRLYDNFRNPKEIFDFARLYNPDNATIAVNETGVKPHMISYDSSEEQVDTIVSIIQRNFGLDYIGVFSNPNVPARHQYPLFKLFKRLEEKLEPDTKVYKYESNYHQGNLVDFDEPGVYVMSYNCMKGLEFDAVIIPQCESIKASFLGDERVKKNLFYVAITRASDEVYCLYKNEESYNGYVDVFGPLEGNEDLVEWE